MNPITCLMNSIEYFTASLPELMLTGEICDETWQRIMGPDSLGSLFPNLPVAKRICDAINSSESIDSILKETFVDYMMMRINVTRLTRNSQGKNGLLQLEMH